MIHPLSQFKYCPKWSSNLKKITTSPKAVRLRLEYYFNSSAAVVAVIEKTKGEILVAVEQMTPPKIL